MKAVFDVKPGSGYDDEIAHRYHFPGKAPYLRAAENAIGDWVLYREPQRNRGRRAYVAVARVIGVEADPVRLGHYYALVEDYLEFADPVPLARDGRYVEEILREKADPSRAGATLQGKSLRSLSDADFNDIVLQGLAGSLDLGGAADAQSFIASSKSDNFATDRTVQRILTSRVVRDANFRLDVCRAYDNRCAVTGIKILDRLGHAETQAAHIKPVASRGPDSVQNGIALSATVHWLFDRHLISVDPNYRLLVALDFIPARITALFPQDPAQLFLPKDRRTWPHPSFLAHHSERFVH